VRTLPYLREWYAKYHDLGLEIVSVHSPEFDFERDRNNVVAAAKKYNLRYPIALDNKFSTWTNYHNQFWPAHYLIDQNHQVVYQHFGEGNYDITEHNIQALLGTTAPIVQSTVATESLTRQTPETYLGYDRNSQFQSNEPLAPNVIKTYSFPDNLSQDAWGLQGEWIITPEKIIANKAETSIKIHFYAAKVYAVMGSHSNKPISVKIFLNGEPVLTRDNSKVGEAGITVSNHRLYTLLDMNTEQDGILELKIEDPDLEIYTFTFGHSQG
jgi:hypothetical protein